MASSATNTNTATSITTTVAQAAEHAVVETVTALASRVQKSNSADLKEIVANVSKEVVVVAKTEDAPTLIEKVDKGSAEVAKDVVTGVETAVKEVEAHPELIAEGAVVAAVGAVGLVAPALVVGSVAVLGKMAADSAMKTIDGIATESSSKLVKEISSDLATDVGDGKKPLDAAATVSRTDVTVEAKATTTTDGGEATTTGINLHATRTSNATQDGTKVVAVTAPEVDVPTAEKASSKDKPIAANADQNGLKPTPDSFVDQKSTAAIPPSLGSDSAVAAAVAVAYKQPSVNSSAPSTFVPVASSSVVSTPAVTQTQENVTTPMAFHASALSQTPHDTSSHEAATSVRSTADDNLTHLHQKFDSIHESLHRKDFAELYQKMDAMHTTLQTMVTLLTTIAQGQVQMPIQSPIDAQSKPAVEVPTPVIIRPLSLITPPLPPTTVETLLEMRLENLQDVNTAIANSEVASAQPPVVNGYTSKRSGILDGLGKLFYLRS